MSETNNSTTPKRNNSSALMVINNSPIKVKVSPGKSSLTKKSSSVNSVETTERCSTDSADPAVSGTSPMGELEQRTGQTNNNLSVIESSETDAIVEQNRMSVSSPPLNPSSPVASARGMVPFNSGSRSVKSNNSTRRRLVPRPPTVDRSRSVPPPKRRNNNNTPEEQEQALFEQRLCDDTYGVAVRKINNNGKSNLRYVRCVEITDSGGSTARSVASWMLNRSQNQTPATPFKALVWGKKKDVRIALTLFREVRKGKTTDRAKRNSAPQSQILSLITADPNHPSLDIEAPTTLDRDKFARAFGRFLNIPIKPDANEEHFEKISKLSTLSNEADEEIPAVQEGSFNPTSVPPRSNVNTGSEVRSFSNRGSSTNRSFNSSTIPEDEPVVPQEATAIVSLVPPKEKDEDEHSHVSSLTGHAYDQELVEELHNALNELRSQLEESRAEAARAVKVAEQAIQSAERNNSIEWQNTVTHKAAEAAAQAQKRSAAALAKQRLAEERLEGERRAASFWRKQAALAEEEAGALQTRAAAAEVQRAALEAQLKTERKLASHQFTSLKSRFNSTDASQRGALEAALDRNRVLELELDVTRRDLQQKSENNENADALKDKKKLFGRKKSKDLSANLLSGSNTDTEKKYSESLSTEQILKVQAETQLMRQQFELLKKATAEQLEQLPDNARLWGEQISEALLSSKAEVTRLQEDLAMESASRRKLLQEVQDLRGGVRVYCRPRPSEQSLISLPSHDTIVLHRDEVDADALPSSFEFDRVFSPDTNQEDVYTEIGDVCLGVLDGYRICLMAYGPTQSGKTCTILGEVKENAEEISFVSNGIHLRAMEQLFTIAERRSDRYKDTFSLTIVEVHNERIRDLLASTQTGETRGEAIWVETKNIRRNKNAKQQDDDTSSTKPTKLEIRTDLHGETVVQGLVSVEVKNFEDVISIWKECLDVQRRSVNELGSDLNQYRASAHIIATLKVTSSNIATGMGSVGRIQFVDLAGADVVPRTPSQEEPESTPLGHQSDWKFVNRSLEVLSECVEARIRFDRSVPYRNSTLTHILRDSLESDTKVLLLACISADPKDSEQALVTLKFANRMRRVSIGKATKHTISPP